MLKVFLDANVYFAGIVSDEGASHLVLEMAARKKISLYSSKLVLRETERNLRLKCKRENLKSFHRFLQKTKIHIAPFPEDKMLEPLETFIHPKDLPVLGAALTGNVDYLITLDRHHFFTATLRSGLPRLKIMTPGDFIREIYLKGKF